MKSIAVITSINKREQWDAILAVTQQLTSSIESAAWDQVTDLQIERGQLIKTFFNTPVAAHDAPWVATSIQALLKIDKALVTSIQQAMSTIVQEVSDHKNSRQAIYAYKHNYFNV